MKKMMVLAVLTLFLWMGFGGIGFSADTTSESFDAYPIMKPDPETLHQWLDDYEFMEDAHINTAIASRLLEADAQNLGTSMSLLDRLKYTPSERNQGSCGDCWVWAGTGVMEVDLDVQKNIYNRLSTQFINSCRTPFSCCGGTINKFAEWYSSQKKAIPWSNTNASFKDGSTKCSASSSSVSCSSISTTSNYPITSISASKIATQDVSQSTAIANIKNVLQQNKAVEFDFWLANSTDWNAFYSFWGNKSESDIWDPDAYCDHTWSNSGGGGHAVLIVGYDDTATTPYWVVLNSWGTNSGRPNGLFRMKMNMNYSCMMNESGYSDWYSRQFSTLDIKWGGTSTSYAITSPTPGSTLSSSTVTFQWNSGAAEYWLYVGSSTGAYNYYSSGSLGTSASATVQGLPGDGSTVYVRLWYRATSGGDWAYTDCTYKASSTSSFAITSPTPGSTLSSSTVTFQWNSGAAEYWLFAGSDTGSSNYYSSGSLGTATSATASGLPNDGSTVYVRLWYRVSSGGTWAYTDCTYKASGTGYAITSPKPGSTLTSTSVTFQWNSGAAEYWLFAGSSAGSSSYYSSGSLGTATTATVTGLPGDGSTIYVRLWYRTSTFGNWSFTDCTYQGMDSYAITSPTPGSTLTSTSVAFQWSSGAAEYWLCIGSGVGAYDYYLSGSLGTSTSVTAAGLPSDGSTVYVRLWYKVSSGGSWSYKDYTYKAVSIAGYAITSPTPDSTLTSTSVTFQWDSGAAEYWMFIGSKVGGYDYYFSGSLGASTSASVTGLPNDGSKVYVRLWYRATSGGSWAYKDFTYTAAGSGGSGFNEQFKGSASNWLQDSGSWSVASSEYYYTAGKSSYTSLSTYNQTYTDMDYSAKLWRYGSTSNANRVIIRASGSIGSDGHFSNEYMFQYTRDGSYSVYKKVSGVSSSLKDWTSSSAIKDSDWNILRVVAVGSSFDFYINGTKVWSGSDTSLKSGRVGVGMYDSDKFYVDWATLTAPSTSQTVESTVLSNDNIPTTSGNSGVSDGDENRSRL